MTDITLTQHEIELLHEDLNDLNLRDALLGNTMYKHLFEKDGSLEHMFTSDIDKQSTMFLLALKLTVFSLEHPKHIDDYLKGLALRHKKYNVKPQHYKLMAESFIQTLHELLGERFTPEHEAAWYKAFLLLASRMIKLPNHIIREWKLENIFTINPQ